MKITRNTTGNTRYFGLGCKKNELCIINFYCPQKLVKGSKLTKLMKNGIHNKNTKFLDELSTLSFLQMLPIGTDCSCSIKQFLVESKVLHFLYYLYTKMESGHICT
jgi:hypothetical protein